MFDPSALKIDPELYKLIKNLQLNPKIPLFRDRLHEIEEFFSISHFGLIKYYLTKGGFPNTPKAGQVLIDFFEHRTTTDKELKEAYTDAAFHYSVRLMLGYEKFRFIIPYVNLIKSNTEIPLKDFKVLDYGCGLADMSLLFAALGAKVTLVDLDDKKYEFAIWRFKKRGYKPNVIKIKNTADYAELPKSEYNLIFATEIFEHVRDPLILLKNLTKSLNVNGFMIDSMGGVFERELVGDHLEEALKIGKSKEYSKYYNEHYKQILMKKELPCLFKRVK